MRAFDFADTLAGFLNCSPGAAAALGAAMRLREYQAGKYLHHQGDEHTELWLIFEGTVQLQAVSSEGQSTVISAFGPGQLIGGNSDADISAYDTRAIENVIALEIGVTALSACVEEWPELGAGLSRIYAGQLSAVLDRLAVRVTLSAVGRFYRELLRLAGPSNSIRPAPVISAVALSAQTTRETGSRATSALERRGIIKRAPDGLTIVSRRMLENMIV